VVELLFQDDYVVHAKEGVLFLHQVPYHHLVSEIIQVANNLKTFGFFENTSTKNGSQVLVTNAVLDDSENNEALIVENDPNISYAIHNTGCEISLNIRSSCGESEINCTFQSIHFLEQPAKPGDLAIINLRQVAKDTLPSSTRFSAKYTLRNSSLEILVWEINQDYDIHNIGTIVFSNAIDKWPKIHIVSTENLYHVATPDFGADEETLVDISPVLIPITTHDIKGALINLNERQHVAFILNDYDTKNLKFAYLNDESFGTRFVVYSTKNSGDPARIVFEMILNGVTPENTSETMLILSYKKEKWELMLITGILKLF